MLSSLFGRSAEYVLQEMGLNTTMPRELQVTKDLPRTMKLPVVRYSPEGAVLDT